MAAVLLNEMCSEFFEAQSAGLEPGTLNPLAVEALQEIGIDISGNETQSVFDVFKTAQLFAYAITVCNESESKGCPIFAGVTKRLHWPFPDPSHFTGTHQQRLSKTRELLKEIRAQIDEFCEKHCGLELQA